MNRHLVWFVVVLSALIGLTVSWVEFRTDVSDFFFRGDSPETALVASGIQSGELSRRYILLIESERADVDRISFVQALQADLRAVAHVSRVRSMAGDQQDVQSMLADYMPYRMALFSVDPQRDVPNIFVPEMLQERAGHIKSMLLNPENLWLKPIIRQDPMMLVGDWALKLKQDQAEGGNRNFSGLILETSVSGLDAQAQRPIHAQVLKTFDTLNTKYEHAFSLRITGVPRFAMAVQAQVSQDVQRVGLLSISLMVLLFLIFFRSLRGLLWVSLILLGAVSVSMLVVSLVFGYVHALTIAIGATLIGVCVDYPIHAMVHGAGSNDDSESSTRRIWPSLLLGGLTTVIGYIALSFTGYPGMQQIALFAGMGIATALLLTRFVLPHLMQGFVDKMRPYVVFDGWLRWVMRYRNIMRLPVMISAMIIFLLGFSGLLWVDDLNKLSPSLGALKIEDQAIRKRISSIEPGRFILVQATDFETALQINEQVFARLQNLKQEGGISSFSSLYPWLASVKLQRENLAAFQKNITPEHQQRWRQALRAEGLSVKLLGNIDKDKADILSLKTFEAWPYKHDVSGQYLIQNGQALIMTWLGRHDADQVVQALSGMKSVRYISQRDMINRLAGDYRVQAMHMLLCGALAIFVLLAIRFRHVYTALNILLPALISVLVVVGVWGLSSQPMGMLHLIGLLLAVAICVDYGIFVFENRAGDVALTFQAIVVSAMTTTTAFASLAFAESPALQALAWTVAPGVVLGFLLCPLLIRQRMPVVQGSK